MRIAFFTIISLACMGFFYAPGIYTFVAWMFILISCLPILLASYYDKYLIYRNYPDINWGIYWVGIAIGIWNLNFIAKSTGYDFIDIFSFKGIVAIAAKSTAIRYVEDTTANSGNPILLAFSLWLIYRVSLKSNNTKSYKVFISFLPVVFYTILTTEKWPTFLSGVFYFSSVFSSNNVKTSIQLISGKIKYVILILLLMVISLSLRGANEDSPLKSLEILFHYVFSSYYGLGYWLVNYYLETDLTLGSLTFIGPLSYITGNVRPSGVFPHSYYIYGNVSNIYTAFRYVIEDFSIVGVFILNSILSIIYILTIKAKYNKLAKAIQCLLIFSALLSTNVTLFVHNSVLLSIFLCISFCIAPTIRFKT